MRTIVFGLIILLTFGVKAQNPEDFFENADAFFGSYCQDGRVDYEAVMSDASFVLLVGQLNNGEIPKEEEAREAYLINAYNLFVINKIVQAYPIDSPMDDASFFTGNTIVLAGEKMSLNHLENEILRKEYDEPRLHFVLVCGAVGCPPIVDFAYTPDDVSEQMEHQADIALNNPAFVYQNDDEKTIYLSEIFNWYTDDFGKNYTEVVQYINIYRGEKFNEDYKVKFYPYDWRLNIQPTVNKPLEHHAPALGVRPLQSEVNLQTFTAGSLLGKGKMDITLFNTLYTENENNWQGVHYSGYRATFVTHLLQYTIGVTKNKRFNIGLDVNFRSNGRSSDPSYGGIKQAFAYKNNDSTRVGVTSVGLRLKFQPFKSVTNFSLQSTLYAPTIKHPEGYSGPDEQNLSWADWNRITWWNQFFYSKTFASGKMQLFTELDFLFRFKIHESQIGALDIPVSVFLSYFPSKKITIYAMTQHVQRFANNYSSDPVITDWVSGADYTVSGLGFKYQILPNLNVELLYTKFWRSRNGGLGETFNLGIKYLTK
ncbi:MAG: DUF547 domain-containing protein [Crocinitomicaceae bacterium]|nr:DUF547 domain-containing protein [Crocinitomicaceae bacterium]